MSEFRFKQFTIKQDKAAAKVGTDGVLLGAWANMQGTTILDIGTGTGLIGLMLAQRFSEAQITALEIDKAAAEECTFNFENSPWKNRLKVLNVNLKDFNPKQTFDTIVSNPPFYTEQVLAKTAERTQARSTLFLPFELLLQKVTELLYREGTFSVIIPHKEEKHFITLANNFGLFPNTIVRVGGKKNTPFKRCLMDFSFQKTKILQSELVIEINRNDYTPEYKKLTSSFYLR